MNTLTGLYKLIAKHHSIIKYCITYNERLFFYRILTAQLAALKG